MSVREHANASAAQRLRSSRLFASDGSVAARAFHSEEEAASIVHSELGLGLSQRKTQKLISKSRITDLRNGGQHSYVSARRLFWVIRELRAVAHGGSTQAPHHQ